MGYVQPFQPHTCAAIERSEFGIRCKRRSSGFCAGMYVPPGEHGNVRGSTGASFSTGEPPVRKKKRDFDFLSPSAGHFCKAFFLRNMHRPKLTHTPPFPQKPRARREPGPNPLRTMGAQGRRIKIKGPVCLYNGGFGAFLELAAAVYTRYQRCSYSYIF